MNEPVYVMDEVVGTSRESIDDAIRRAVRVAAKTVRHLSWFEVRDIRGTVVNGDVGHFQVTLKYGFRYETDE